MHIMTTPLSCGETYVARTFCRIDLSSWISWACYSAGIYMAANPAAEALASGGPAAYVLGLAVAVFFVATALIQQHMHLSLRAGTFGHPKKLVTDGVFGYSRNPIYVAFLVPLASLGVLSATAAFFAIAAYLVAMTQFVIIPEERVLTAEFGKGYAHYRAHVPRWLGFV